jgi:hypothetical protein
MTLRRLDALPVLADVLERLAGGPVGPHREVLGRHEAPGAPLRIAEEVARDLQLFGAERAERTLGHLRRQLLEETRPVVRRHLVEDPGHLAGAERLHHLRLLIEREVLEHLCRGVTREDTEDDPRVLRRKVLDDLRDVGWVHVREGLAKRRVVLPLDQLLELRLQKVAEHRCPESVLRRRDGPPW